MRDSDRHAGFRSHKVETNWWARVCAALVLSAALASTMPAQTFTTLFAFCYDCTGGYSPFAGLIQGTDGSLYGVSYTAIYKTSLSGGLTQLYGEGGEGNLVQAGDGNFYGTSSAGGTQGYGSVFKITPGGKLTTLHEFDFSDGAYPGSALIQASDGSLYGVTYGGGITSCAPGCGTVFRITLTGAFTTLYDFCSESDCGDGYNPYGPLIQATDGSLYGTTFSGGTAGGTVFKLTQGGKFTALHSFAGYPSEGVGPSGALIQALDGDFYGSTLEGGAYGGGTIFQMSPNGALNTLYDFCPQTGCTDGDMPNGGLLQAADGRFYGTTREGGSEESAGTISRITRTGILTTLYTFGDEFDGGNPQDGLLQDTNGVLYGTAFGGGMYDRGVVFSLSVGLGPFVTTQPTSAKAGKPINILGSDLTGATSVTFNGTPATFAVNSSSLITTTVPASATTGEIEVTTPHGTLRSNVRFRVIQ